MNIASADDVAFVRFRVPDLGGFASKKLQSSPDVKGELDHEATTVYAGV